MPKFNWTFTKNKIKLSTEAIWTVLKNYRYLLLVIALYSAFDILLQLITNWGQYRILLASPFLSLLEKFQFLFNLLGFQHGLSLMDLLIIDLIALLQALAITLLIYNFRNQKIDKTASVGTGIAAIIATFGLGCPSCGTSLLAPILTLMIGSASPLLATRIGLTINILTILLLVYSIYRLGYSAKGNQLQKGLK